MYRVLMNLSYSRRDNEGKYKKGDMLQNLIEDQELERNLIEKNVIKPLNKIRLTTARNSYIKEQKRKCVNEIQLQKQRELNEKKREKERIKNLMDQLE